jgi:hypothetical protein
MFIPEQTVKEQKDGSDKENDLQKQKDSAD